MHPLLLILILGVDLLLKDPGGAWHPIAILGRGIQKLERLLYPADPVTAGATKTFVAGTILTFTTIAVPTTLVLIVHSFTEWIHPLFGAIVSGVVVFYCLAAGTLIQEVQKVFLSLEEEDTEAARQQLQMLVGRDTSQLNPSQIAAAAIETLAENLVDGVITPLFFLWVSGPAGAVAFKAISTLDSMIGYRNERYEYFGKTAARLDDLCNFIPARVTAFFILPLCSILWDRQPMKVITEVQANRLKHPSPNSAHAEAAYAAILGVRLGGPTEYNGKTVNKDFIYPQGAEAHPSHLQSALHMTYASLFIVSLLFLTNYTLGIIV